MEFEEVVEKSDSVASFHENVDKYFESRKDLTKEEKRKHYWALFYRWKEKMSHLTQK